MRDFKHAKLMMSKAEDDHRAIINMLDPDSFADGIFGFHVQQAIEKSLKAWLSAVGVSYKKTHDIDHLLHLLSNNCQDSVEFEDLSEYNPYAVQYRYDTCDDDELYRELALADVANLI
jgi:HEPN domain-containing protein